MIRDFKGIWVPRELWLMPNLKPTSRCFLIEIDSLDKGEGCWARNEHFSELFGLSKSRCSEIINHLEKEGFITINERLKNGVLVRILTLKNAVEKPKPPSENRRPPSENRRPPSENRTPLYKDEINNEINKEREGALSFLNKNFPARYQQDFEMKYKKNIRDFEKFQMDFNDTVDLEKLSFDSSLFGRLGKYARNWIENQNKYNPAPQPIAKQNYQTHGI